MNLYDTICKYPDFISLETNTMSEEVRGLEDTQEEAQDDSQEESSEEESSEEEE